jgi:hypothetical protein
MIIIGANNHLDSGGSVKDSCRDIRNINDLANIPGIDRRPNRSWDALDRYFERTRVY